MMRLRTPLLTGIVLLLCSGGTPVTGSAQATGGSASGSIAREALVQLADEYEQTVNSPAYSEELRSQARREAARIRERLEQGDFQIGDQIALEVEGENDLSKAFVVSAGPSISLPSVGSISLRGVLRSELESHLRDALARYIRDPVVRARSSIRISVMGAVGKAGYYVAPTDMVLSDVLMMAGGPAPSANLRAIRVERNDQRIWEGKPIQDAIAESQTLDQLGIRGGDQIIVPARSGGIMQALQPVLLVLGPVSLLLGIFLR